MPVRSKETTDSTKLVVAPKSAVPSCRPRCWKSTRNENEGDEKFREKKDSRGHRTKGKRKIKKKTKDLRGKKKLSTRCCTTLGVSGF